MKFKLFYLVVFWGVCYIPKINAQATKGTDFDFAVQVVENDYAGFSSKVTEKNRAEYDKLKLSIQEAISKGKNEDECIGRYISWFNDAHLRYPIGVKQNKGKTYNYQPDFLAKKIDSSTFIIRIPDFDESRKADIANMVEEYKKSNCKNIIIDIRGNGGGMDFTFDSLLGLIYTHKGVIEGIEWLSSKNNINAFKEFTSKLENEKVRAYYNGICQKMEAHLNEFVNDGKSAMEITSTKVSELPRKVAIIIDGNVASSAEQFVLNAKACSDKVTLYGKDNTMGVLDFSNLNSINMPNSKMTLYYPMSRSKRLPDKGIDETGIKPDIRIKLSNPKTLGTKIDQWTIWISKEMSK